MNIYNDRIEVLNYFQSNKCHYFKDIQLIAVYSTLHMPAKYGKYHIMIIFNEKEANGLLYKYKSIKLALYNIKEMELIYQELQKHGVPSKYI